MESWHRSDRSGGESPITVHPNSRGLKGYNRKKLKRLVSLVRPRPRRGKAIVVVFPVPGSSLGGKAE